MPPDRTDKRFDNANRFRRIVERLSAYRRISVHALKHGVPVLDLVRTQFPRVRRDPDRPALLTLELTNICNVRCVYCTSPLGLRPRGFATEETIAALTRHLQTFPIPRLRIIGNGESTLHPRFGEIVASLSQRTRFLSVLSNGQWRKPDDTIRHLLDAPVHMVEVSVDGTDADTYEKTRVGGRFDRLVRNLERLREARDRRGGDTLINVRVMLRPSDRGRAAELQRWWKRLADTVMTQYIVERNLHDLRTNVYTPVQHEARSYPRCSLPGKALNVNWNGDVPLCSMSEQQVGPPGLILGNVNESPLGSLWQHPVMRQYRKAHAVRDTGSMPICRGCTGS